MSNLDEAPVACVNCFSDRGLQFESERIDSGACPNCGAMDLKKLPIPGVGA